MPVPLKQNVIDTLPDNYNYALKRTKSISESAMKNPVLKETLRKTFAKLIDEGWMELVD